MAQTWAPYWVPDYIASTEIVHHPDVDRPIRAEGIVSMLGIPLVAGDRFLGTLNAANREERAFADEDVALLSAFGHHAAVALENSRLYDESRRALLELREAYGTIEAAVTVHEALTRMVLAGGDVERRCGPPGRYARRQRAGARSHRPGRGCARVACRRRRGGRARAFGALGGPALRDGAGRRHRGEPGIGPVRHGVRGGAVHRHVVAIAAATTYLGALVLSRHGDLEPVDVRTLEHAAHIAALLTLAQDAVVNAEERVRGELLTELMTVKRPFPAELQLRARARQVDADGLNVVLVVDGAGNRHGDVTRLLHDLVKAGRPAWRASISESRRRCSRQAMRRRSPTGSTGVCGRCCGSRSWSAPHPRHPVRTHSPPVSP